ncbi:hypothetical protein N5P37_000903 [Trichoderma harzianum]|nr:hypothetical protein N5P37_000903 [Trichoderma harzianum]
MLPRNIPGAAFPSRWPLVSEMNGRVMPPNTQFTGVAVNPGRRTGRPGAVIGPLTTQGIRGTCTRAWPRTQSAAVDSPPRVQLYYT